MLIVYSVCLSLFANDIAVSIDANLSEFEHTLPSHFSDGHEVPTEAAAFFLTVPSVCIDAHLFRCMQIGNGCV